MIDIIITTYNRADFLKRTVESLVEKNRAIPYRLSILDDHSTDGTVQYLTELAGAGIADIHLNSVRRGITYGLDHLWNDSDFDDFFFGENQYLCYLQDDMVSIAKEWLLIAIRAFEEMKEKYNIGFFTGLHAPEHPVKEIVKWHGNSLYIKTSNSATNLIGEKLFWRSIGYVPRLNPDGSPRGMPNNNRGSSMDIYLTGCYSGAKFHFEYSAPHSSFRQGKNILVIPDLLEHIGHASTVSTWRKGEEIRL